MGSRGERAFEEHSLARDDAGSAPDAGDWRVRRGRDFGGAEGYRQQATFDFDYGEAGGGRWSEQAYGSAWPATGPHAGVGPRGYRRPVERIVEEINERLTAHGQIDAGDVEVSCDAGVVTLRGQVGSRREKRLAEAVAEAVRGVEDVQNRLEIRRA
jgi:hypothetical protein